MRDQQALLEAIQDLDVTWTAEQQRIIVELIQENSLLTIQAVRREVVEEIEKIHKELGLEARRDRRWNALTAIRDKLETKD